MRFERTPTFDADYARLSASERMRFRTVVLADFVPACDRRLNDPALPWPKRLRIKAVQGTPGILEMTWSFSGPDGRATFEWIVTESETRVRWRRVGGHAIFRTP